MLMLNSQFALFVAPDHSGVIVYDRQSGDSHQLAAAAVPVVCRLLDNQSADISSDCFLPGQQDMLGWLQEMAIIVEHGREASRTPL